MIAAKKTLYRTAFATLVFLVALGIVWVVRAKHAFEDAKREVSESRITFKVAPVLDSQPTVVDFLPSPPEFRDAQIFHDLLYVCGAGGIWVYDLNGTLRASYLVGRELPPSPPIAMVTGTVAGDGQPKLWIATAAGVLIFDGVRFSQIQLRDKSNGNVTSLWMSPAGILLIGFSEGGVLAYNGTGIAPFHPTLRGLAVTTIAGGEGDLWIGTRDRGVIHWRGGSTEDFNDRNGLPDSRVLSIATSPGRVLVGTPVGVSEFRDGKHFRKMADGVFSRTLLVANDHLLIGTVDEGIVNLALGAERTSRFLPTPELHPIVARRFLEIDWKAFAVTADGLYEHEPRSDTWTRRVGGEVVSWTDRNISALSVDPMGKLWIGYFDRGIDIADPEGMNRAIHIEDDDVFCVNRIVWDSRRNLQAAATANGVVLFSPEGKILQRIGTPDGLISAHATDIAIQPDGLAVATAAGVTLLDAGGPESIYAFHGLPNNHVYALGVNGSRLLAGTLGGLALIENGFVRASYTTSNSPLRQNWISAVLPFNDGFFIGTYGGGFIQIDSAGQWTEIEDMPAHTVINPNAMIAVSNQIVAGTLDRGLLVFDTANRRLTTFTAGLPSLNVTALTAASGNLFVGTDNGIVRLPVEKLNK